MQVIFLLTPVLRVNLFHGNPAVSKFILFFHYDTGKLFILVLSLND